jgi:signal peptidase II
MLWRAKRLDALLCWAFGLILAGAVGNLFDRVVSGRVTDFLLFYIGRHQWPAFNVADSAIVIGCGLLIVDQWRGNAVRQIHSKTDTR